MEIKIEVYFYNLKKFGGDNICGLVTFAFKLSTLQFFCNYAQNRLKRGMKYTIEHFIHALRLILGIIAEKLKVLTAQL